MTSILQAVSNEALEALEPRFPISLPIPCPVTLQVLSHQLIYGWGHTCFRRNWYDARPVLMLVYLTRAS